MLWKNNLARTIRYWTIVIAMAYITAIAIHSVFPCIQITGSSMNPTFEDGDKIFVNQLKKNYKRGDIVIFDPGEEKDNLHIKRIVGIPGDHLSIDQDTIYLNGKELIEDYIIDEGESLPFKVDITIPDDEFFVMGDNRPNSWDSRVTGTVSNEAIKGSFMFKVGF